MEQKTKKNLTVVMVLLLLVILISIVNADPVLDYIYDFFGFDNNGNPIEPSLPFNVSKEGNVEIWHGDPATRHWVFVNESDEMKHIEVIPIKLNSTHFRLDVIVNESLKSDIQKCNSIVSSQKEKCLTDEKEKYNWSTAKDIDLTKMPISLGKTSVNIDVQNGYSGTFEMPKDDGIIMKIGYGTEYWNSISECTINTNKTDENKNIVYNCKIVVNISMLWTVINSNLSHNGSGVIQCNISVGKCSFWNVTLQPLGTDFAFHTFDGFTEFSRVYNNVRDRITGTGISTGIITNVLSDCGQYYLTPASGKSINISNSNFSTLDFPDVGSEYTGVVNFIPPISRVSWNLLRIDGASVTGYYNITSNGTWISGTISRTFPVCAYSDVGSTNVGSGCNISIMYNGVLGNSSLTSTDGCVNLSYTFINGTAILNLTAGGSHYRNNVHFGYNTGERDASNNIRGIVLNSVSTCGAPPANNAPLVNLISPANNSVNTTTSTPEFCGNVSDESATTAVTLWLNNTAFGYNATVANNTNTCIVANASVGNGDWLWNMTAYDGTNTGYSTTWNISVYMPAANPCAITTDTNYTTYTYCHSINVTNSARLWVQDTRTNVTSYIKIKNGVLKLTNSTFGKK